MLLSLVASFVMFPPREAPALIPWPKKISAGPERLELEDGDAIVADSAELLPLAKVLQQEIALASGVRLTVSHSGTGRIRLRRVPNLSPERYRLNVADEAVVEASDYQGACHGSVTLLQSLSPSSRGGARLPRLRVEDAPDSDYRGLMIDVARRYHRISTLEQCVELCRLYKIRYLQLHLTDDQAFTFPSQAFPRLNQVNTHGGPSYTREELLGLVRFADERGVTIVPELEVPGHAAAMIRAYPELFKITGTKPYEHHATINFAKPEVLAALEKLVGEVAEVFRSSPYIHIGGDEADFALADGNDSFQKAFAELGLEGKAQGQLYRRFLSQMNEVVKRQGKKTIVWEGFGREPDSRFQIPPDITVMEFESAYYLPSELVADGHPTINAAWTPLYVLEKHVWPPEKVLEWDIQTFGRFSSFYPGTTWFHVPQSSLIRGAQVCSWEAPEFIEIANLRRLLAAAAERTWNAKRRPERKEWLTRLERTDEILQRILSPISVASKGVRSRDPNGFDLPNFESAAEISLQAAPGLEIRYTLDGSVPDRNSTRYASPLGLDRTTTLRAAAFRASGSQVGYEIGNTYYLSPPRKANLATGKKVTSSGGTQWPQSPAFAVDGNRDRNSAWWAGPAPQWLSVDLGRVRSIGEIDVYPYWDGSRVYRYTVQISQDGRTWETIADRRDNRVAATESGDKFTFAARRARFVRVNMLSNSANEGVHLVELEVWPSAR